MTAIRRRTAVAGAIIASVLGISAPALAAVKAQGSSTTEKVGSASWGAVGNAASGSPVTGSPYSLTWQGLGATTQYFEIDNTGTLDLASESYTTTNSAVKVLGTTAPAVTLTACVGADWNTSTAKCSGTQVTLDTSAAGATTATAAIATNDSLSVRATTSTTLFGFTTSVSVTTARSDVRAATTTIS